MQHSCTTQSNIYITLSTFTEIIHGVLPKIIKHIIESHAVSKVTVPMPVILLEVITIMKVIHGVLAKIIKHLIESHTVSTVIVPIGGPSLCLR